jgi:signal transduction histidine kinase/CheY-like chemotaxis protein
MSSPYEARPTPYLELLNHVSQLAYHLDSEDCFVYLNQAGTQLLEMSAGEWQGKLLSDFVHEDDRSRLDGLLTSVRETGSPAQDIELRMVGMRGTQLRTRHNVRPLNPAELGRCLLGAASETGEIRRLEEQLQQSQKLETIGLLTGGIAHDFNNMLAAILGFTELMIEERQPGDPDLRTLSYIQKSTERAAGLVKQLLAYSRKTTAELKPIRLGDVVDETLGIIERTLPKSIRIVSYTDEEDDAVLGDAGRIQQALLNLCLNARDAMVNGGELRISVENLGSLPAGGDQAGAGPFVRIKIQDTGIGMRPEILEKIWEPFFTTKETGKGTGLGLALVQSIMRAHGGYVQVESHPGSGTSFYLYLPAAPVQTEPPSNGMVEPLGGTETVLIVDDEEMLLDLLVDLLTRKGYRVITAHSGVEALETLRAAPDKIDLVISDNMMPGMMGRELAREIRRHAPNTRVVLCSGYNAGSDPEPGELENVSAYVHKPYQRRELLTRVREVLDARSNSN